MSLARGLCERVLALLATLAGIADRLELAVPTMRDDRGLAAALLGRARRWMAALRSKLEAEPELLIHAARRIIADDMAGNGEEPADGAEAGAEWRIDDARDGTGRTARRSRPARTEVATESVAAMARMSLAEIGAHLCADLGALAILADDAEARRQVASLTLDLAMLLGVDPLKTLTTQAFETRLGEAAAEFCPGRPRMKQAEPEVPWEVTLKALQTHPTLAPDQPGPAWARSPGFGSG
jgi:hypothetical protein